MTKDDAILWAVGVLDDIHQSQYYPKRTDAETVRQSMEALSGKAYCIKVDEDRHWIRPG